MYKRQKSIILRFAIFCTIIIVLGVSGNLRISRKIVLPNKAEIASISVFDHQVQREYTDIEMDTFLRDFRTARRISKKSVQDIPDTSNYWVISIHLKDGTLDQLYLYQDKEAWYLERPYEGIYQLSSNIFHN